MGSCQFDIVQAIFRKLYSTPAEGAGMNPDSTESVSLIERHNKASISRPEQTSNAPFRFVNSSNVSTFGVTFINLSAVLVSLAHARNEASIPKPAASTAMTSAKSSTKV